MLACLTEPRNWSIYVFVAHFADFSFTDKNILK